MALPNNPDEGGTPKRPLPPELKFLTELPDLSLMEDDELIAFVKQQHALIHQHADLIRAYGLDPDKLIAFTESATLAAEKSCQKVDELNEKLFHALADNADAQYQLFKAMEAIVAERPFDDDLQEMKELVEELRPQMPKE